MAHKIFLAVLFFCVLGASAVGFGQGTDAAIKPTYFIGEVAAIDNRSVVVTTKTGPSPVMLTDKTVYKRIAPETPTNLAGATAGALSDIAVGDKVTISALLDKDGRSMNARTVYFITRSDITKKNAREAEEWRTRGISGRVTAVNSQSNQLSMETGGLMNKTTVTLTPKSSAKILRYASDSVKFADSKPSTLSDIKTGDQIRALGDKGSDGTTFAAETIISGSFRQIAGTVKAVDAAKNEVLINDLNGKDVTIAFGDAIMLKRFPAEIAERMMAFQTGGGGATPPGQGGQARPVNPNGGQASPGGQGRGGFGGGRGGGLDDMVERAPNITGADLKVGEMIAILTSAPNSATATPGNIKAIKLIAGVDPFIKMAQAAGTRRGGQGVQGGFSIPGLDGIGFP